jgi:hypothetical protein
MFVCISRRAAALAISAAFLAACDSPTDPENPSIKNLRFSAHEVPAAEVASPEQPRSRCPSTQVDRGGCARRHTSVYDANRGELSFRGVSWTVADTNIVYVSESIPTGDRFSPVGTAGRRESSARVAR